MSNDIYKKYKIPSVDLDQAVKDAEKLIDKEMPIISDSLIVLHEEDFEYYESLESDITGLEFHVEELEDQLESQDNDQVISTSHLEEDELKLRKRIRELNSYVKYCNITYKSPTGKSGYKAKHKFSTKAKEMSPVVTYGDSYVEAAEKIIDFVEENSTGISNSQFIYELTYPEENR